ncbi:MAG: hypothetical protein JWQ21_1936 [Herminiimonas sp.]|nr:hypothetical protein [Herminiimonas sp.]
MVTIDFEKWIAAYIEVQESVDEFDEKHPLFWAIIRFWDLNDEHPGLCWKAILEIVDRKPSLKVIGMLAAGPLEDLIHHHGHEYIDRIESEAKNNPDFKRLLDGVWESSTPEIWSRVEAIRRMTC